MFPPSATKGGWHWWLSQSRRNSLAITSFSELVLCTDVRLNSPGSCGWRGTSNCDPTYWQAPIIGRFGAWQRGTLFVPKIECTLGLGRCRLSEVEFMLTTDWQCIIKLCTYTVYSMIMCTHTQLNYTLHTGWHRCFLLASTFVMVDSGQEGLCCSGWGTQIPRNLPNGMVLN